MAFIFSATTRLRGTGRAIALAMAVLSPLLASPAWSPGRLWLLRFGYDKLTRPHPHADDWGWRVDHTAQIGATKCWGILGGRLTALPADDYCLRHAPGEPLALFRVPRSDGEVGVHQLEQTMPRPGVPRDIVRAEGAELHAGVSQFCRAHPAPASLSDITHTTALVFQHALQSDTAWDTLCQRASDTRNHV